MNICVFGHYFILNRSMIKSLERDGHKVVHNLISKDTDVLISESIRQMYNVYRKLKFIKKNQIKLINFILDIPPWRIEKKFPENSILKLFRQDLYHYTHKNRFLYDILKLFESNQQNGNIFRKFSNLMNILFNTYALNQTTYLHNYRNLLKISDLNLSISKFTKHSARKYLKLDSEVCYPCVDSELILKIPKSKNKYDAVNISRIMPHKRQDIFVKAAKKIGLKKILLIGPHQDKTIRLDVPHIHLPNYIDVLKKLSETLIYVAPSEFEGFGVTPIEAAFLDKITIASDIYTHKEVLGEYPLYFKLNDVDDLAKKMKMVMNGDFSIDKNALNIIKEKYSYEAGKKRLIEFIESII